MSEGIEAILYCSHCAFAVHTALAGEYETKPRVINTVVFDETAVDYETLLFRLTRCPKCDSPFLCKYTYLNHHEVGSPLLQGGEQLYPTSGDQLLSVESVPAKISQTFEQAKKCYEQNLFEPCVIMCRKCLEAVCENLQAKGGNLAAKIDYLRKESKIDDKLLSWATQLRLVGNDAAHDLNVSINRSDAKDSIVFLNALLLYIYTLDARFIAFQKRTGKR